MSRIACVWADLGEDDAANEWYEHTHIPDIVTKLDTEARNGEPVEDNMFKEIPSIDGAHMTIYELPDEDDVKDLDARVQPALDKLPEDTRIDTRCYREFASWTGEEWRGDHRDIQMWIVVLWQPEEAVHDQFVEWFKNEFAPGMLESPELLRTRIFKLENASLVQNGRHEQQELSKVYQYLTFWEFDCDDLPWEILVYLGSSERWRYYVEGGLLNWQIGQYLVSRIYPEGESAESPHTNRVSIILNGGHKEVTSESDGGSYSGQSGNEEDDDYGESGNISNGPAHSEPYVSV